MKPYMIYVITIYGYREVRWAVVRNRTEYVFATYAEAENYAASWR